MGTKSHHLLSALVCVYWAGEAVQLLQCMSDGHEALVSIPSTEQTGHGGLRL